MCGVIACHASEALGSKLGEGRFALAELEPHPPQDPLGLRELHLVVLDDLDEVAPGVEEVEPAARADLHAGGFESAPRRLLVVDHEPEMAGAVRTTRAALHEREELVADVDEGSAVASDHAT